MSLMPSTDFLGMDTGLGTCGACGTSLNADTSSQLLPCLHSMCSDCMPSSSHEVAVCPVCGMLYSLQSVTPNPLFYNASSMSSLQKCGCCECTAVGGWCVECEEALCEECVSAHKRVRMTRDHTIKTQISSSGYARKRYCPIHKDEPYKLYCLTCGQLTCRDCQLSLHRNHNFQFVGEVVSECRQKLETLVHRVKEQRAYTQRSLQDLEGRLLDIEDVMEGFKDDVKQALKEMRDMLVQKAMKLMSDAKMLCTSEMDRLKQQQMVLQKVLERQAYLLAFSQKTLDSIDQCVLLSCANQVQQQLQIVLTQNPPPLVSMLQISLHINKLAIQEALSHFGKVSWRPVPFACLKKHRPPKTVKETPPASVSDQALSLDNPDQSCLLEPAGGSPEVPPMATRGGSVSSPTKAVAESTTSSPGCTEGRSGLDLVGSMECEPSSTVPDPIVGKPSAATDNTPSPPCPLPPVVDLTVEDFLYVERPASWDNPVASVVDGVSTANPSGGSFTSSASTRGSVIINLDKDLVESNEGPLGGMQEGSVIDYGVKSMPSANAAGNILGKEGGSPDGLRLRPLNVQTDTTEAQGAGTRMPTEVNMQGVELECPVTLNVLGAESGDSQMINVQGVETESMQGTECLTFEHVQKVQEVEPDVQKVQEVEPDVQDVISASATTEHAHEVVSDCATTEHVQEFNCVTTEHVQEMISDCVTTEHVQEMISDCVTTECGQEMEANCVTTEHVQEMISDCVTTEHVQEMISDCVTTETGQEEEPNGVSTEHVQVVAELVSAEHVQTDVSAHPEEDQSSAAPSGSSSPPSSPHTPCQESFLKALNLTAAQSPEFVRSTASSASQGTDAAGQQADTISSYCCPLEDDDLDEEGDCIDVEIQDEEIYQLLPKKHWLPHVSVYQLALPSIPVGLPPPQFRLRQGQGSMEFLIQEITEENESAEGQRPARVAVPAKQRHCAVCRIEGMLNQCAICHRGYHKGCHIPPLITRLREDWVCGLCVDMSAEVRLQEAFEGSSCMSPQDQKKCEHLLLSLWCSKYRPALFMQNKEPASSTSAAMSIILIRGRLLQKLPPPYRTPAEFVSDIWLLLDILLKKAKWKAECERQLRALQMIFSRRLQRIFSQTLHPSLLRNPYSQRQRGRTHKQQQQQQQQPSQPAERPSNRGKGAKVEPSAGRAGRRRSTRKPRAGRKEKQQTWTQTRMPLQSQTQMPLGSRMLLQSQMASQTELQTQMQTQSQIQLQSEMLLQSQTETQMKLQ